jgi:hypothetical protein
MYLGYAREMDVFAIAVGMVFSIPVLGIILPDTIMRDRGPLRRMTWHGLCMIYARVERVLHPLAILDDTESGGEEASLRGASTGPRGARNPRGPTDAADRGVA